MESCELLFPVIFNGVFSYIVKGLNFNLTRNFSSFLTSDVQSRSSNLCPLSVNWFSGIYYLLEFTFFQLGSSYKSLDEEYLTIDNFERFWGTATFGVYILFVGLKDM